MEDFTGLILQSIASAAAARKEAAAKQLRPAASAAASPVAPTMTVAAARAAQEAAQPVRPTAPPARPPVRPPSAPVARRDMDETEPVRKRIVTDFGDPRSLIAAIVVAEALDKPLALRRRDWP
ncbi:MAG: hypothetical protein GIW95_06840 [Candidatus Eremiobacteraeota bacterium]|nr:hypothetical protein [Candidatus Eremiobacteraeota bacterium]